MRRIVTWIKAAAFYYLRHSRSHASLTKNIRLVGQLNKFEIWDEETWNKRVAEDMAIERDMSAATPSFLNGCRILYSMDQSAHISVLLAETIDGLAIKPDGIYLDGTFGRGGHSRVILSKLGEQGRLYAIDRDPHAIAAAAAFISRSAFFISVTVLLLHWPQIAEDHGISGKVDGILLDLGVSSPQLDDAERGFSFMRDGPLDMRMDPTSGISAADWLAKADVEDITFVLREYGEEKFAWKIANAIVDSRGDVNR